VAALIAQPNIVMTIAEADSITFQSAYKGIMNAMTVDSAVETSSAELNDLVSCRRNERNDRNHMANHLRNGVWWRYGCNWSIG